MIYIGIQSLFYYRILTNEYNLFLDERGFKEEKNNSFTDLFDYLNFKFKEKSLTLKKYGFCKSQKNFLIRTVDYLSCSFHGAINNKNNLNFNYYNNFITVYNFNNIYSNNKDKFLSFNDLKKNFF